MTMVWKNTKRVAHSKFAILMFVALTQQSLSAWSLRKTIRSAATTVQNAVTSGAGKADSILDSAVNSVANLAEKAIENLRGVIGNDAAKYAKVAELVLDATIIEPLEDLIAKNKDADVLASYINSWEHKMHKWQRQMQINLPLAANFFVYSHNAFNSKAYAHSLRYIDPNHEYSIYDQMRMESRWIELDIHWFFSMDGWPWQWGMKPVLCHSMYSQKGCSPYDRPLSEGLSEIRKFLELNRDELVVIKIEDYLTDSQSDIVLRQIRARLGDLIYRPRNGCEDIPAGKSPAEILNSGKNLIIYSTKSCRSGAWSNWVHFDKGITLFSASLKDFREFPSCFPQKVPLIQQQSPSYVGPALANIQEDRTELNAIFYGTPDLIDATKTRLLVSCGIGTLGVDYLTPLDGRLSASIWSWDKGKPGLPPQQSACAFQNRAGRWEDTTCERKIPYACRSEAGDWYITRAAGSQASGQQTCAAETSGRFVFSLPLTGLENAKLLQARANHKETGVWLNYSNRLKPGIWQ